MITSADEQLIRSHIPDTNWRRLTPLESWRTQAESSDGLSLLLLVGTYSRDATAAKFGAPADELPWEPAAITYIPLVLDRDIGALTLVPSEQSGEKYFVQHLNLLTRERRLRAIRERRVRQQKTSHS